MYHKIGWAVVIVLVLYLDLQLHMQSVSITTDVVSSNRSGRGVQHYFIQGRFVSAMNGVHLSCDRRTPNKPHKRTTRRAFNMAGIGLAAVAYVSMDLMDSSDDEEGSIAYLFECVFFFF